MTYIPDHLRQISLDEEIESISYKERDRKRHIIPQVDNTMDSRDSLIRLMKIHMIMIQMK